MRAGTLNERITIEQLVAGEDSLGQPADSWQAFATVWASVRFVSGRQFVSADREASRATASMRIRPLDGLDASMRVTWKGDVYEIIAVLPARDHIDLAVACV